MVLIVQISLAVLKVLKVLKVLTASLLQRELLGLLDPFVQTEPIAPSVS